VTGFSELRLHCVARPGAASPMRHAVSAFLAAAGRLDEDTCDGILTAVGEALANVVEHAYRGQAESDVELVARLEMDSLAVDVFDRGTFVEHASVPDRGFGLRIMRAIARSVTINVANGTHVHMIFST
jgi:anti-sigma regulatory factor (Ser/Thr protein kinase)